MPYSTPRIRLGHESMETPQSRPPINAVHIFKTKGIRMAEGYGAF